MKRLFSIAVMAWLSAGAILAQDRVQKVITIKNGNLGGIVRTIKELLPGSGIAISSSDLEHIVLSGPKEGVTGFEEIIKQLDIPAAPRSNVETTVYMIVASTQPSSVTLPAGLEPVITQLKSVFAYKGFRVLDAFVLRSRSGDHGETSGFLPPFADANLPPGIKVNYHFKYNRVTVDNDKERLVRIDGLNFGMRVPVSTFGKGDISYIEAGISTDVDIPQGKKVVVGKTSAVEGADSALILVISAKVVD